MSQHVKLQLLLFSSFLLLTKSQPMCNGVVSFEKISRREPNPEKAVPNGILLEEPGHAVAIECLASCLRQPSCFGLTVDYGRSRCTSYDHSVDSAADFINSANNFFSKVCYRNISLSACGPSSGRRLWTMDRSVGALLDGFVAREFKTTHRLGCSKECLTESSFNCSSASYELSSGRCLLSKESRRSQPQAYRDTYLNGTWTYLENNCIDPGSDCAYDRKRNKAVLTVDLLTFANDLDHCEMQCRSTTHFLCRSYSFLNNRCFLSSDDRVSSHSLPLPTVPDSTYGELVCPSDDCTHGAYLYEKVIGHILETGEEEIIPVAPADCEAACDKLSFTCRAIAIDYARKTCLKLDRTSQGRSTEFKPSVGRTFMEKTCLRMKKGSSSRCSGSHGTVAFIRVPGIELPSSYYSKTHELIQSRQECQQKCLDESSFICKSVFYDEGTAECKLSAESLHSLPGPEKVIRNANYKTSHMENTCSYENGFLATCSTQKTAGQQIIYVDKVIGDVLTAEDCESICRKQPDCRSFGYSQSTRTCSLSSVSSRIPDVQMSVRSDKYDYYEFACTKSQSTLTPVTDLTPNTIMTTSSMNTDGPEFRTNMSSTTSEPVPSISTATTEIPSSGPSLTSVSTTESSTTPTNKPSETSASTGSTSTVSADTPSSGTTAMPSTLSETSPTTTSPPLVSPPMTTVTKAPSTIETGMSSLVSTLPTTTTNVVQPSTEKEPQTQSSAEVKPQITTTPMPTASPLPSTIPTAPSTATITELTTSTKTTIGSSPPSPSSAAISGTTNNPIITPGNTDTTATTTTTTASSGGNKSPTPTIVDPSPTPTTTKAQTMAPPTQTSGTTATAAVTPTTTSSTAKAEPTLTTATASPVTTANVTQIPGGRELCPKNYVPTYERIPGFEPIGEYYFTLLCGSDPSDPGIVHECSVLCSERSHCRGFVVDHQNYLCYGLIADAVIPHLSMCVAETKDFYNRICIPSSLSCGRIFTFDRILDQAVEFNSIIPRYTIPFISKDACKCLCLEEKKFTCRSMSYENRNSVCRIYDQSRTHVTLTFTGGSEFFENACASPAAPCSYIRPETDIGPVSVIKSLSVRSLYECKWACDSCRSFHCRSFNFVDRMFGGAVSNLCLLYSDNRMTARKGSLKPLPRSLYYQKVCT